MDKKLSKAEQVLDTLDEVAGQAPGAAKRQSVRRSWRTWLKVTVKHPGGNRRQLEVVTRNLSSGGLAFLNNGFLHIGTRCELQPVTAENTCVDVRATVVRCRLVAGSIHEVSVRFDEPVDPRQFVSTELGASILIVDDAEDQLRLTGHFLSKAGAEVVTANRGDLALKLCAEQDFDLVLLDVEMPGISGPEVAKTLRERGLAIPIIAYTANDDQASREECLAAGCSDVLIKPLSSVDLIDAVASYLAVSEPITSKYAGDAELADFVNDFITGLVDRIQELERCLQAQDSEQLGLLARQLKIAASDDGGCGFAVLSDAAHTLLERLAGTVDWASVEAAMTALNSLSCRVRETKD